MTFVMDKFTHSHLEHEKLRVCSKKFVQQGHNPIQVRIITFIREHRNLTKRLLTDFFNRLFFLANTRTTQKPI